MSLLLTDDLPTPKLATKSTLVEKPRFPVINAHNHLAEPFGGGWEKRPVAELLDLLDAADVRMYVDLDGGWGESILQRHLDHFKAAAPERFQVFGGADWSRCYAENLVWVGALLDRCPNFYIDFSARIAELGRQPYSARHFFVRYAERILFGTDASPDLDTYRPYYRFLETDDEYFSYGTSPIPGQGRWSIYGLYLPDDVLMKGYFQNAERILLRKNV